MTTRRLACFAALLLCATNPLQALAQAGATTFPERTVRIIVPFPAGGATDIVARALAERMSATWKQPVIVENIAGATGAIGTAQAARAPRDGYTLIAGVGTTTAILKALKPNLAFDPINDFAPISLITSFPNVLVVRGDFPAGNVKELIDVVKANPGKFTYASSGYGGSLHLAAELFKLTTKTDIVHVPYTGSAPAITALLGGHVDLIFDTIPSIWPSVQSGKLKALEWQACSARRRRPRFRRSRRRCPGSMSAPGRASWRRPERPRRWLQGSPTRSSASRRSRRSCRACSSSAPSRPAIRRRSSPLSSMPTMPNGSGW
jgi:tripartite-type tricarboxylate transporter receptor subunit TctC